MALASELVTTDKGAGVIVILRAALLAAALASATVTLKLLVPRAVGIPVIAPVEVFSCKPVGKLPTVIDQVRGAVPPLADNKAL